MGKGTCFISGLAVGVFATRFIFKHKSDIEAFFGMDSSDNTDDMFNDKISTDESVTDNIKKGYYAIAKTYAGGDSDRDRSETYSECVSFENEEAVFEGEARDSYEDSESPSEDEKTEESIHMVNGIDLVPEDREIFGFQTQSDGSMVCVLDVNKVDKTFYNSVTNQPIQKELIIKYLGIHEYLAIVNNLDSEPNIRYIPKKKERILFIIRY